MTAWGAKVIGLLLLSAQLAPALPNDADLSRAMLGSWVKEDTQYDYFADGMWQSFGTSRLSSEPVKDHGTWRIEQGVLLWFRPDAPSFALRLKVIRIHGKSALFKSGDSPIWLRRGTRGQP